MIERKDGIKVLSQKRMNDSVTLKLVRDGQGRVYRVRDDGKSSLRFPQHRAPYRAADGNASFYESFEAYPDYNTPDNFIPEGWQEINTPENTPTPEMIEKWVNNTWYVSDTGDGYWLPITPDGVKEMFIHFAFNDHTGAYGFDLTAYPQDEWLITPEIKISDGQQLFFWGAIDYSFAIHYNWNTASYEHDKVDCNLEVLVSADNGEHWTKLWDAINDELKASGMTDDELYDAGMAYRPYSIDLADYVGKTVKIAFRYINNSNADATVGNSLAIDAIKVTQPMPEAAYYAPEGSLFVGLSEDLWATNNSNIVTPAYAEIEWKSASNEFTAANEWAFATADGETVTEKGDNVAVEYPYTPDGVDMPQLTASNEYGTDTYTWGQDDEKPARLYAGGNLTDADEQDNKIVFGLGNYDFQHNFFMTPKFDDKAYCFGTGADEYYGGAKVVSAGELFKAPVSPLYTDRAFINMQILDADPDAELEINVYTAETEADDYGGEVLTAGELIAHGRAKAGDAAYDSEGGLYTLGFDLYAVNGGKDADKPGFVIDDNVIFEITGFAGNDKVREFSPMTQMEKNADGRNYAYVKLQLPDNAGTYWYAAPELIQDFCSSLILSLRGEFSFMHADESAINLPGNGGSQTVKVQSLHSPAEWWMTYGGQTYTFGKPVTVNGITVETSYDEAKKEAAVTFSAEKTDQVRGMAFNIETVGASQTFTIMQNPATGIGEVEADGKQGVRVDGNSVTASFGEDMGGKAAVLVAADGKVVASALTAGDGTVSFSVASLPGGIYVVKAGTVSVKFVK